MTCPKLAPVGVVVPVYNRATTIVPTLDSISNQVLPPARLVVVDDGSTDGSANAAQAWIDAAQRPFESHVIRVPHLNVAAARNSGLKRVCDLPFVAFLDSDDCWPVDFLARTVASLNTFREAAAATVDRRFFDTSERVFQEDDCSGLADDAVHWMFANGAGVASSTLLRVSAVVQAGGWDPSLSSSEDAMLFVRTALQDRWLHVPGAPVDFHHGNAASRGEEGNLSKRDQHKFYLWATTHELIYRVTEGIYPEAKRKRLRPGIASYWYRAGKTFAQQGRQSEARACYQRALHWQPRMFNAWRRRVLLDIWPRRQCHMT